MVLVSEMRRFSYFSNFLPGEVEFPQHPLTESLSTHEQWQRRKQDRQFDYLSGFPGTCSLGDTELHGHEAH